jgi:5-methylcytosine-specific restriction enzyme A
MVDPPPHDPLEFMLPAPLADGEREVDPVADMRPLCPNCHAVVHLRIPPLTLDKLRGLLR